MRCGQVELPSIVVAIPARNEEAAIAACLASVERAVDHALDSRRARRAYVQVATNCCDDATARLAKSLLSVRMEGGVSETMLESGVGAVRDAAVRAALHELDLPGECVWIFSTDADSTVGPGWISDALTEAAGARAVCVVGLVELDRWEGSPEAWLAYERILAAKMYDGSSLRTHGHVYGANLAIRADAYLAVGGFPSVGHGEDQRLVDSLVAAGFRVLWTRTTNVTTSGRRAGRADDGLADLLRTLDVPIAAKPATE